MSLLQVSFHVTNVWHILALRCASFYVGHDEFIRVTWCIHTCDICLIHMCDICDMSHIWMRFCIPRRWGMPHWYVRHPYVCHDAFICVMCDMCLIHMCDMMHSYVRHPYVCHDAFIYVTCDMTHSDVWHDAFICVTWCIYICDVPQRWDIPHSYVWDMPHSYVWNMPYSIWDIRDMSHIWMYVWHDAFIRVI